MELKHYQTRALESLAEYFRACQKFGDPDTAFYNTTKQIYGGQGVPYHPIQELPEPPYICLRLPTGGGKTLLAAHAIGVAADEFLRATNPLTLWLTPSKTIREQTLRALKDPDHPYRRALAARFPALSVLDISEALSIQPGTLSGGATIIVATLQAFRVDDTEGRKVYEPAGALMSHFDGDLPGDVERYEDGKPIPTLSNVLRLHRPLVIVDEAHNARTDLSFDTLARFRPSCILELTATPDRQHHPSNVLVSVSAAELKTESMIKLPIRLETHPDWPAALSRAVALRNRLEKLAQEERAQTGEYIRPVMLLQAQPRRQGQETVSPDALKKALIEDQRIPQEQIAISIGELDELEGLDVTSPTCPLRYIITVQKLREGWDCPFAYILFSVAEQRASTAVEQILGRVLRLPHAGAKAHPELNLAYAFTASYGFAAAAESLREALVSNGFERQEAKDLILPVTGVAQPDLGFADLPLFTPSGEMLIPVPEEPDFSALLPELANKVDYKQESHTLMVRDCLSPQEVETVTSCFTTPGAQTIVAAKLSQQPPARSILRLPLLAVRQGDLLEAFQEDHFLNRPWQLSKCDPYLPEELFPRQAQGGQQGTIDINEQGHVYTDFMREVQLQLAALSADQGWSVGALAAWLDRKIRHHDLPATQSLPFLRALIERLLQEGGIGLAELVREKFRLRRGAEDLIQQHRAAARQQAYQQFLFAEAAAPLVVSPEICFTYDPDPLHYPCSTEYSLRPGQHNFHKHYYPTVGNLRPTGEEFQCAQNLDSHPKIKTWVRNLERQPQYSFWLQTSTDRFYPDFVCLLEDGRYLVVESKGEHLYDTPDSAEKRQIGALWEERSGGHCLFIMSKGTQWNAIAAKIG